MLLAIYAFVALCAGICVQDHCTTSEGLLRFSATWAGNRPIVRRFTSPKITPCYILSFLLHILFLFFCLTSVFPFCLFHLFRTCEPSDYKHVTFTLSTAKLCVLQPLLCFSIDAQSFCASWPNFWAWNNSIVTPLNANCSCKTMQRLTNTALLTEHKW